MINYNNYFVQVTDKYSFGSAVELHENLSVATARRIYNACVKAYPSQIYLVKTNALPPEITAPACRK